VTDVRVAISETHWAELCAALGESNETAGILFAGIADGDRARTLCINSIHWIPEDAYEIREPRQLRICSHGWMPALGKAAAKTWQPIFFHTHPGNEPRPSRDDRIVADQLAPTFLSRVMKPYASLILGGSPESPTFTGTFDGRPISFIRAAGDRLRLLAASDISGSNLATPPVFDRQVRAFGTQGQRLLGALRFGVVGSGGTGSAVFEQLVRVGAGEVVLIDDDLITETNPTRIHESGMEDVGKAKVDVMAAAADRIGLGTEVIPIDAKVTERRAFEALRDCDAVFGCTDDNAGRAILSRLAYYYCLPVLDIGVLIGSQGGQVSTIEARLTVMTPGTPCLFCRGRIDSNRLREEMQGEEEIRQLAGEGYARGLGERDPAVISYTTMIASLAVDELFQRLFGFGLENPSSEVLVRIPPREIRHLGGGPIPGHFCCDPAILGRGDREPPLDRAWS
jgi:molybdopterin/thiamine biosynthesis adenylyltransferase